MKKWLIPLVLLLVVSLAACAAPAAASTSTSTATETSASGATETTASGATETSDVPKTIKVGVYGPLSGSGANWGLAFKRPTEMWADEVNAEGGLLVDGERYPIEVFVEDTRLDAALAKTAAERLVYENQVRYIMGPAIDMEQATLNPVSEPAKVINFSGAVNPEFYSSAHPYCVLAVPLPTHFSAYVFSYLMETDGAKTFYSIAANDSLGTWCQQEDITAAKEVGLEILADNEIFEPDITDFYPLASKAVAAKPDIISVAGAAPENTALFAKAARELGYEGRIMSDVHQDIETVVDVAGEYAEGLLWIAGIPPSPSEKLFKFMEDYEARYGVWNDEAATKIVSAWMIGATIQAAGKAALTDNDAWVEAMSKVEWPNIYIEGNPTIKYIGEKHFGKNSMVGVPMGITEVQNGKDVIIKYSFDY